MGRLIPAGTGLAYHENRKNRLTQYKSTEVEEVVSPLDAGDVEEALKQALSI